MEKEEEVYTILPKEEIGDVDGLQPQAQRELTMEEKLRIANKDQHRIIMSLTVQCKMGHHALKSIEQHVAR